MSIKEIKKLFATTSIKDIQNNMSKYSMSDLNDMIKYIDNGEIDLDINDYMSFNNAVIKERKTRTLLNDNCKITGQLTTKEGNPIFTFITEKL